MCSLYSICISIVTCMCSYLSFTKCLQACCIINSPALRFNICSVYTCDILQHTVHTRSKALFANPKPNSVLQQLPLVHSVINAPCEQAKALHQQRLHAVRQAQKLRRDAQPLENPATYTQVPAEDAGSHPVLSESHLPRFPSSPTRCNTLYLACLKVTAF